MSGLAINSSNTTSPRVAPLRFAPGALRLRSLGDRHRTTTSGRRVYLPLVPPPLLHTLLLLLLICASPLFAKDDVYQPPSGFIKEVFRGKIPAAGKITLSKTNQAAIKKLIGHPYSAKRVRYWSDAGRTVWILSEIGKTKPITTGYVVKDDSIEQVKVLIYRESHGWEVRQKFFTKQFDNAKLVSEKKLDKRIDNIVGATLSARALTRMAKLALYLDQERKKQQQPK